MAEKDEYLREEEEYYRLKAEYDAAYEKKYGPYDPCAHKVPGRIVFIKKGTSVVNRNCDGEGADCKTTITRAQKDEFTMC